MPFRDVIGHRRLVALLSQSVSRDTLPPSLILTGPEGVGKRLVATATAQALNCPAVSGGDACGVCPVCTRIARGVHPDVPVIVPGDNGSIKIEQVRDVIDRSAYRPFEGRRRVVIVDDADAMMAAAQSALLKTLEEPPAASAFMLITAHPDLLLPTVRSRCPQLRFRALSADEVAAALVRQGRSETEAHAIAASAGGSVAHALDASGGDLVEARDVAVRVLAQASATTEPGRRIDGAKELLAKTGAGGATDREQVAGHLRAMSALLRDIEVMSIPGNPATLANPDVKPALERLSAFSGERGLRAFEAVDQALDALSRNAGVKTVADWLVLQL